MSPVPTNNPQENIMTEDLEFQIRAAVSDEINSKCEEFAKAIWVIFCIFFIFIHPLISLALFVVGLVIFGVFKAIATAKKAFDDMPEQQVKRSMIMAKNHLDSEKRRLGLDNDWVEKHFDSMADYFLKEIRGQH